MINQYAASRADELDSMLDRLIEEGLELPDPENTAE